ncbi:SDR family NAD(P)-dependent oxidoreductase [Micromonospora sp. NPDC093277]|uniref:SDR family NAD(P)-dependent oxidoreductase n=1 Tax=Micromonospora sp. NPDC093277 TaxID=3364291 RepID=UPI0037F1B48E
MTMMSGKVCLVTGGTSGIGRETAARLAEFGATVVVVGRDAERGRAAVTEIRHRAPGAEVDLLTADMSSLAEVRRLAVEVLEKYDRLDVLDNNARGKPAQWLSDLFGPADEVIEQEDLLRGLSMGFESQFPGSLPHDGTQPRTRPGGASPGGGQARRLPRRIERSAVADEDADAVGDRALRPV